MNPSKIASILEDLLKKDNELAVVEFKKNWQQERDIGEYLSAMANSALLDGADRAWVVWGVEDGSHTVVGTRFNPFKQKVGNQALIMWLQQKTVPRADFEFHSLDHPNGKVVLLEIRPPRTAPIAFDGIRYIRIDSHKTRLSEHADKEARIWVKLGVKGDWTGEIIPEASVDDLDEAAIETARKRFTEYLIKNEVDDSRHEVIRKETSEWNTATLLNKARITKNGKITRSALLLLGKDEAAHFLSPTDAKISWILREENGSTRTSQPFGPPLIRTVDQLFSRIRNLTLEEMPDGTLFPVSIQQYDTWVIREALHNCIAHQDYTIGGKINVVEYPNRLVFSNLGQFIPPSIEWMLENQSPPEHYRNQWLIDGMIRLRMIEQVGSGIRRMFQTQRERLLPMPEYTLGPGESGFPKVEVVIEGRVLDERYTKLLMRRDDLSLKDVLSLDKVQKGVRIPKEEAKRLRQLGLVEGRYPRIFVSGKVAATTSGQATHILKKGFDNDYYRDLLEKLIREHGPVSPAVINELFLEKLPDSLDDKQKRSKIRNLTYDLAHRRGVITNIGDSRGAGARWVIREAN